MKQSTPNGEVRWNTAERKVEKQVMEKIAVYSKVKVLKLMSGRLFIVLIQQLRPHLYYLIEYDFNPYAAAAGS